MKSILLVLSLFSFSALAHIELGTYKGTNSSGYECNLHVMEQYYIDNKKHPLNERVKVAVESNKLSKTNFTVNHPSAINVQTLEVSFNHDQFQGLLATSTGAQALIVEVSHEPTKEGPQAFIFVDHNWKTGNRIPFECKDLKYLKP